VLNVYRTPLCGGQWVKGTTFMFDLKIVSNVAAPMAGVDGKLEEIKYS
jgi:hypothetical protein